MVQTEWFKLGLSQGQILWALCSCQASLIVSILVTYFSVAVTKAAYRRGRFFKLVIPEGVHPCHGEESVAVGRHGNWSSKLGAHTLNHKHGDTYITPLPLRAHGTIAEDRAERFWDPETVGKYKRNSALRWQCGIEHFRTQRYVTAYASPVHAQARPNPMEKDRGEVPF